MNVWTYFCSVSSVELAESLDVSDFQYGMCFIPYRLSYIAYSS